MTIKVKTWIIFERFDRYTHPWILHTTKLDVSEDELSLCIQEQIYGVKKLKKEAKRNEQFNKKTPQEMKV